MNWKNYNAMQKRLTKQRFHNWVRIIEYHLHYQNIYETSKPRIEHFYELGWRGKNHRITLLDGEQPIAYGRVAITRVVLKIRGINNLYEEVKIGMHDLYERLKKDEE